MKLRPFVITVDEEADLPTWLARCPDCNGPMGFSVSDWFSEEYADNPYPGFVGAVAVECWCVPCFTTMPHRTDAAPGRWLRVWDRVQRWAVESVIVARQQGLADELKAKWAREDLEQQWHQEHPSLFDAMEGAQP